jgi:hypothetical protein
MSEGAPGGAVGMGSFRSLDDCGPTMASRIVLESLGIAPPISGPRSLTFPRDAEPRSSTSVLLHALRGDRRLHQLAGGRWHWHRRPQFSPEGASYCAAHHWPHSRSSCALSRRPGGELVMSGIARNATAAAWGDRPPTRQVKIKKWTPVRSRSLPGFLDIELPSGMISSTGP